MGTAMVNKMKLHAAALWAFTILGTAQCVPSGDLAGMDSALSLLLSATNWRIRVNVTFADISAGQGASSGQRPKIAVDSTNAKVLVVTTNGANGSRLALFRCNLDGSSCTYTDISAAQGASSGTTPSLVIDNANSKLLVATDNGANGNRLALFRCNLDGSSCTYTDISAAQGASSGTNPSLTIDSANSKLLVATENGANGSRPALFRCNLDGSSCTYADISAGQAASSGRVPDIAIDSANGKLLVVTGNTANGNRLALFRCNLDGTSCTYADISAGAGPNSSSISTVPGASAPMKFDAVNGKIVAVSSMGGSGQAMLFRCNSDGSSCSFADGSVGQGQGSATTLALAIDSANRKILIAANNGSKSNSLFLNRCNIDMTGCSCVDLSGALGTINNGLNPAITFDTTSGKMFIAVASNANGGRAGLFIVDLAKPTEAIAQ